MAGIRLDWRWTTHIFTKRNLEEAAVMLDPEQQHVFTKRNLDGRSDARPQTALQATQVRR
jgi:hypothetical protein